MIDRQSARHKGPDFDFTIIYVRLLLTRTNGKNTGLRRINNRAEFLDPEHTEIRHGKGAALKLSWRKLAFTGFFAIHRNGFFTICKRHILHIFQHRHNKTVGR